MKVLDKLKEMMGKSPDKFQQGIDKAASFADQKTGGKYGDKINRGADQARKYVDNQGNPQGEGGQQGKGPTAQGQGGPPPQ